jgi:hypothetical protein
MACWNCFASRDGPARSSGHCGCGPRLLSDGGEFSEYLAGFDDVDEFLVSDQAGFALEEQVHPVRGLALCEKRRSLRKCLGFSKHLEACARDDRIIESHRARDG